MWPVQHHLAGGFSKKWQEDPSGSLFVYFLRFSDFCVCIAGLASINWQVYVSKCSEIIASGADFWYLVTGRDVRSAVFGGEDIRLRDQSTLFQLWMP